MGKIDAAFYRLRPDTRRLVYYSVVLTGIIIIILYNRKSTSHPLPPALPPGASGGKQVILPEELLKTELWAPLRPHDVVPRIIHYIWFSPENTNFRFHHYMSFLSAYRYLQPEKIYLWCSNVPAGKYFDEIKVKIPVLSINVVKRPSFFSGRLVVVPEHQSEIMRMQKLIEYGGIYLDTDVIVLKPFDDLLKYDVTMPYYDSRRLNPGIILAKPKAAFMEMWLSELKTYFDDYKWDFHATFLPAQIASKNKPTIHIEFYTMDSPHWKDKSVQAIYDGRQPYDWHQKYVFHIWHRIYQREHSPESIKNLTSCIGEIFRHVYYGSSDITT